VEAPLREHGRVRPDRPSPGRSSRYLECGLDHSGDGEPSAEEFAHPVFTRERALSALVGALRRTAPCLDELLLAGRGTRFPRLLTSGEYELLVRRIEVLDASFTARIPAVLRAALPLAVVPESLMSRASRASRGQGIGDLVGYLQRLPGDSTPGRDAAAPATAGREVPPPSPRTVAHRRVPGRGLPSGTERTLRHWSERVAARLAIHQKETHQAAITELHG
jgi:hypothetical protein